MKLVNAICITVLICLIAPSTSVAEMLGPYSGTVIDASTGKPIEGASVLFYWIKIIPNPIGSSSDLIDAKLKYTNASGKYDLSVMFANTGLHGRLDSTHVIIYEPGYQVYIKEISHDNPYSKSNPDFHDRGNIVRLERIPPGFDHKTHYGRIEEAIRSLERHDYSEKRDETWAGILKSGLRMPLERDQFLRRTGWEQRRPDKEGHR